jgi:hypothetical protein
VGRLHDQAHRPRARIYLQIAYGAYALGDVFVAYDIGDYRTLSAAAHEGWHQFAARQFKGRLPAFVEEGVATQFEDVDAYEKLPRWNLKKNSNRLLALRRSIENDYTFPLDELVSLDAGQVIHRPGDRIDAFYAQSWAFVRFLIDGENGYYRPAFDRMIADAQSGVLRENAGPTKTVLERYLGRSLDEIDIEFTRFCRKIAITDYRD